jgi:hypothetical protein
VYPASEKKEVIIDSDKQNSSTAGGEDEISIS